MSRASFQVPFLVAAILLGMHAAAEAQPVVTLTVDDASAAEAGPQTGSFTVTRSADGNTAAPLEVWVTVSGSATDGNDYTAAPWSVRGGGDYSINVPGGQLSQVVTLTPKKDNLVEGTETFGVVLRLSGDDVDAYTIGAPDSGEIAITDDVAVVTLVVNDDQAAEAGPQTGSFTVTRSANGNTAAPLEVWVTVSGSAAVNSDYTASPWSGRSGGDYSINIPGGQLAQVVTLTPLKDNLVEGTESFSVMLRGPGDAGNEYTIGAETAGEIAITDDVAVVTLVVNDDQAAEAGPQNGSFTVTRSANGNTAAPLEVWVTVSGSATYNSDYTVSPWSLRGGGNFSINIPGAQLSQVVTLTPVFDQFMEGDETFAVQLRPPGDVNNDYTIGAQANGQITIRDFVQLIFKDGFEDL